MGEGKFVFLPTRGELTAAAAVRSACAGDCERLTHGWLLGTVWAVVVVMVKIR